MGGWPVIGREAVAKVETEFATSRHHTGQAIKRFVGWNVMQKLTMTYVAHGAGRQLWRRQRITHP